MATSTAIRDFPCEAKLIHPKGISGISMPIDILVRRARTPPPSVLLVGMDKLNSYYDLRKALYLGIKGRIASYRMDAYHALVISSFYFKEKDNKIMPPDEHRHTNLIREDEPNGSLQWLTTARVEMVWEHEKRGLAIYKVCLNQEAVDKLITQMGTRMASFLQPRRSTVTIRSKSIGLQLWIPLPWN